MHNGIIENHEALRQRLQNAGFIFTSDTDTEVIAHLISLNLKENPDLIRGGMPFRWRELQGAYAIAVMEEARPERIIVCRNGAPLLLGLGDRGTYAASDASALLQVTRRMIYLEEGDVAELRRDGYRIVNCLQDGGAGSLRIVQQSELTNEAVEMGPYAHFMQKEIFEQPGVVANTLEMVVNAQSISPRLFGSEAEDIFNSTGSILILACGTSYHAGLVARYWLEAVAGMPCNVEIASEYRYRNPAVGPDTLVVGISQSGETADTLAALSYAKLLGHRHSLAICNVAESALVRQTDLRFLTRAGPEIGVASTKAFTTQLASLMLLTMTLAKLRGKLSVEGEREMIAALRHLPVALQHALQVEPQVKAWAERFSRKTSCLIPGPWHALPDCHGRRAQAQGNFLHPR